MVLRYSSPSKWIYLFSKVSLSKLPFSSASPLSTVLSYSAAVSHTCPSLLNQPVCPQNRVLTLHSSDSQIDIPTCFLTHWTVGEDRIKGMNPELVVHFGDVAGFWCEDLKNRNCPNITTNLLLQGLMSCYQSQTIGINCTFLYKACKYGLPSIY